MPVFLEKWLPHRPLTQWPVHIIYRLKNSIPRERLLAQVEWYTSAVAELEREFPDRTESEEKQQVFEKAMEALTEEYEYKYDRLLDQSSVGPFWLQQKAIANLVGQSWLDLQSMGRVKVLAYCIMSNHVHVILQSPNKSEKQISKELGSHKKYTGRRANRLLGREGPFWDPDYFDRDVRVGKLPMVMDYVLNNPVVAGFATSWKDWPHTYVNPEIGDDYFG